MTRYKINKKDINQNNNNKLPPGMLFLIVVGGLLVFGAGYFLLSRNNDEVDDTGFINDVPVVTGPSLRADKEKIDFGDVIVNNDVTATFNLTNMGDEPLRFTKEPYVELKAGC